VAQGAGPGNRAEWAPFDPNAARRAAYGRTGDAARGPGPAPCDRTRPASRASPSRPSR